MKFNKTKIIFFIFLFVNFKNFSTVTNIYTSLPQNNYDHIYYMIERNNIEKSRLEIKKQRLENERYNNLSPNEKIQYDYEKNL